MVRTLSKIHHWDSTFTRVAELSPFRCDRQRRLQGRSTGKNRITKDGVCNTETVFTMKMVLIMVNKEIILSRQAKSSAWMKDIMLSYCSLCLLLNSLVFANFGTIFSGVICVLIEPHSEPNRNWGSVFAAWINIEMQRIGFDFVPVALYCPVFAGNMSITSHWKLRSSLEARREGSLRIFRTR